MQEHETPHESREQRDSQDGHDTPAPTAQEIAARLGCSVSTVYRHAKKFGRKPLGRWQWDPTLVEEIATGGAQ